MPDPARPLSGVRALLLDLDGVIVLAEKPVPGAAAALGELAKRRILFRIVTNTSLVSRATLSRWGASMGAPIPPDRFQSALSVSAAYTARRFAGQPLYVLASDDARTEFKGQHLLTDDEAGEQGARAAAVVVGDSPEILNYQTINRAFRLISNGATLVAMHKNRWWMTPDGPTIDSGSIVVGLEFAAGVRAITVGKPSLGFFQEAASQLAAEAASRSEPRLRRRDIAMVGDDLDSDVRAAQRAGLRGVFVLTGKHARADLEAAVRARKRAPDLVAESLADVVAALD
jgi:HAD superfamily hydrolase (TIGR01458 family)